MTRPSHEHFKLEDVFTGPPIPPFRDEFQSKAKRAAKGKEE